MTRTLLKMQYALFLFLFSYYFILSSTDEHFFKVSSSVLLSGKCNLFRMKAHFFFSDLNISQGSEAKQILHGHFTKKVSHF